MQRNGESLKLATRNNYLIDIEALGEGGIRDLCGELFPFTLVPELLESIRKAQLVKEMTIRRMGNKESGIECPKAQKDLLLETSYI